jgi:hypothetical protein
MDLTFNFNLRCVQPFFNDYSAYALGRVRLAGQAQQDFIPDRREIWHSLDGVACFRITAHFQASHSFMMIHLSTLQSHPQENLGHSVRLDLFRQNREQDRGW